MNVLISCATITQLIFVCTYVKSRFSHDIAHLKMGLTTTLGEVKMNFCSDQGAQRILFCGQFLFHVLSNWCGLKYCV